MSKNTSSFYRFIKRCQITDIIAGHYNTFYDYTTNDKRCSKWEIFWQIIIFAGLSIMLTFIGIYFTKTALNTILTIQSILTPFLFSTLFIIADKRNHIEQGSKDYKRADDTTKNIAFCILLSIALLFVTVIYLVSLPESHADTPRLSIRINTIFSTCMYFLILNQVYVFLMIIKRVNKIFN